MACVKAADASEQFAIAQGIVDQTCTQSSQLADSGFKSFRRVGQSGNGMKERFDGDPFGSLTRGTFSHDLDFLRIEAQPRNQNFGVLSV